MVWECGYDGETGNVNRILVEKILGIRPFGRQKDTR
jgi:hypothetical protein